MCSHIRAATSGIFLLFLALAFLVSQANGELFLPILFVGLAITSLIGSLSIANPRGVYGGLYAFVWGLGLAFCFLFGFWPWILFVVAGTMILGAFAQPIMAAFMGMSFLTTFNGLNTQSQQPYQAPPHNKILINNNRISRDTSRRPHQLLRGIKKAADSIPLSMISRKLSILRRNFLPSS